jgi:transposase
MRLVPEKKHHWLKLFALVAKFFSFEPALWLFISVEGVEPTNNSDSLAIRPAVIWRRTSFGSQTAAGSRFVERMLTVVTTLKSQRRNVLDFITAAVSAARSDSPSPSLLPEVVDSSEQVINVA